jgi:hypothetical protein
LIMLSFFFCILNLTDGVYLSTTQYHNQCSPSNICRGTLEEPTQLTAAQLVLGMSRNEFLIQDMDALTKAYMSTQ